MTKVAEMAHTHVVDLDQVNGVAAALRALLLVVIGGKADHADARYLILARTAYLVRVAHGLRVVVVVVLVADGDEVGVKPLQLEPDGGRVRVCDDSRVAASQPE